ncbi:myozenin-1-like isoform X2 [Gambusia affinis]|uniref:myozenin-1-like isoform X2 n=1 Tax=Gambusia affinis TaxID=33528 RepID=UPI001CDD3214|nr:myozenin-1-like isoform X2 [Gambusia affinis]
MSCPAGLQPSGGLRSEQTHAGQQESGFHPGIRAKQPGTSDPEPQSLRTVRRHHRHRRPAHRARCHHPGLQDGAGPSRAERRRRPAGDLRGRPGADHQLGHAARAGGAAAAGGVARHGPGADHHHQDGGPGRGAAGTAAVSPEAGRTPD